MSSEERIIALEREVIDTRNSAVELLMGWLEHNHSTPAAKRAAAQWFDSASIGAEFGTARLARLLAGALRSL